MGEPGAKMLNYGGFHVPLKGKNKPAEKYVVFIVGVFVHPNKYGALPLLFPVPFGYLTPKGKRGQVK